MGKIDFAAALAESLKAAEQMKGSMRWTDVCTRCTTIGSVSFKSYLPCREGGLCELCWETWWE